MSRTTDMVRLAHFKGYRVSACQVTNANGKVRKLKTRSRNSGVYAFVNIPDKNGDSFPVPVHRLVAFQKFGEAALEPGVQTRHLDGNSLNNLPDNIVLGTPTQNSMDRNPHDRRIHVAKGNQKYTAEFIAKLRAEHEGGTSYKALEKQYGVARSMLSYYLSPNAKRRSFTHS